MQRWLVSYNLGGDFKIEGVVTADTPIEAEEMAITIIRRDAPQWFKAPGPRLGAATISHAPEVRP
jgi:hypothetical protein